VNAQGDLCVTAWNFNGWGERYSYQQDRLVATRVADVLSLPLSPRRSRWRAVQSK